jgi:GNAT superfamily N-acetyltransferase
VSEFASEVLTDGHRLEEFDCGRESLNAWLIGQGLRAQAARTARTYVWTRAGSVAVVAYYSIAPTQVIRADLPSARLAGGSSVIPGYLLARLALDRALHAQGLGGQLLLDALDRIVIAAGHGGGRLVVVDALDAAAAAFYRRHDFAAVAGTSRLYLKVSTAEAVLDAARRAP